MAEQDSKHATKAPALKGKWETKASGANCAQLVEPSPGPVQKSDQQSTVGKVCLAKPNKGSIGVQTTTSKNKSMGPAQSIDSGQPDCDRSKPPVHIPVPGVALRVVTPADLSTVNTTTMAAPLRKMINRDEEWMAMATTSPPQFLVGPTISPIMEYLDQWCARSKVGLPTDIPPVIKHRILSSMPEGANESPTDEWFTQTLRDALTFLEKTG